MVKRRKTDLGSSSFPINWKIPWKIKWISSENPFRLILEIARRRVFLIIESKEYWAVKINLRSRIKTTGNLNRT